jgi:uncharacterized membrane protein
MESYLLDWANLLLRWLHVIVAIAWIGSSFYFVFLDSSLTPPEDEQLKKDGVSGELWALHGGGFYHPVKFKGAPPKLPHHLHWFYWESYSTWLSGFALFLVSYLWSPSVYLIDPNIMAWSPAGAIAAALAFLVVFWLLYDAICRTLGQTENGDAKVGALVLLLVCVASYAATHMFAGRAAFLLVGAMLATAMSANVFFWIIPGQRTMVADITAGRPVDPIHGFRGKQRSVHNTYFTLPVLFAMLSNHYSFTYAHPQNWLILIGMMFAGAAIRQFFVMRHGYKLGRNPHPWKYAAVGRGDLAGADRLAAARAQHSGCRTRTRRGLRANSSRDRAALRHVPRRGSGLQECAARFPRRAEKTRPDGVPAGGGEQAHAHEQRHRPDRRRAGLVRAVVQVRREVKSRMG